MTLEETIATIPLTGMGWFETMLRVIGLFSVTIGGSFLLLMALLMSVVFIRSVLSGRGIHGSMSDLKMYIACFRSPSQ